MTTVARSVVANKQSGPMPVMLTVGDIGRWIKDGEALPRYARLAFAEFGEVTPELLQALSPSTVLAPLVSRSFDCVDLAALLYDAGFVGRYRILATRLPNPTLVLREIRQSFPGLDVDISEVGSFRELRPC